VSNNLTRVFSNYSDEGFICRKKSPVKILVVDDEQLDLFVTKKLLGLEFEAEGFTSVDETLRWAKDNHFDVVLIDYYLTPTILAHHVLQSLRSIKGDTFKAFVLSNYVDDQQARDLRAAGFTDIIYKPLTLEKFREQVNA
jgi:CheY-like chemotaxis protein